jgi:hypothetical protein
MNRDGDSVTDLSKARRAGLARMFGGLLFSFRFGGLNPPHGARGLFWLLPGFAIWSGRVPPQGRGPGGNLTRAARRVFARASGQGRCLPISSLT